MERRLSQFIEDTLLARGRHAADAAYRSARRPRAHFITLPRHIISSPTGLISWSRLPLTLTACSCSPSIRTTSTFIQRKAPLHKTRCAAPLTWDRGTNQRTKDQCSVRPAQLKLGAFLTKHTLFLLLEVDHRNIFNTSGNDHNRLGPFKQGWSRPRCALVLCAPNPYGIKTCVVGKRHQASILWKWMQGLAATFSLEILHNHRWHPARTCKERTVA